MSTTEATMLAVTTMEDSRLDRRRIWVNYQAERVLTSHAADERRLEPVVCQF